MLLQVENYVIIAPNNLYNDSKVALDTLKVIFHVNFFGIQINYRLIKNFAQYFPSERTFFCKSCNQFVIVDLRASYSWVFVEVER